MNDGTWLIAACVVGGMSVVVGIAGVVLARLARPKPFRMLSEEAPSPAAAAAGLFGIVMLGLAYVAWVRGRIHGGGWAVWALTVSWLIVVCEEVPRTVRYLRDRELRRVRIATLLSAAVIVLITCAVLGLGVAIVPFMLERLSRSAG